MNWWVPLGFAGYLAGIFVLAVLVFEVHRYRRDQVRKDDFRRECERPVVERLPLGTIEKERVR